VRSADRAAVLSRYVIDLNRPTRRHAACTPARRQHRAAALPASSRASRCTAPGLTPDGATSVPARRERLLAPVPPGR
jgi:N-formylglutamate amidohydrolase